MRILVLSPRQCWPATGGAKIREYYLLRALARENEVVHVHFAEPGTEPLSTRDLPFCREVISVVRPRQYTPWKMAGGLMGRWPLPVLNYTSAAMVAAVRDLLRRGQFDLVHLESIHMTACAERAGVAAPMVHDWHNIESELMLRYSGSEKSLARRFYGRITARRLQGLERSVLRNRFGHILCSDREQRQLRAIAPGARLVVVPNGVDVEYFANRNGPNAPRKRIVFVGLMAYHANIEAAVTFTRQIWPAVHEHLPGCVLTLVGASPDPAVVALGDLPGVEVTGTVPDVRPYYREALAAIVPLRTGSGTRLKIPEAMAAGVPVVSTAAGAEGLAVEAGRDILLVDADDGAAWGEALASLAESGPRRESLTTSAFELVRERYDWRTLGESLCNIYREWLEKAS
jgi:glycosyltransferase involved in cell wall biosynthesis